MNEYIWYLIRATGTVAYILLYVATIIGLYTQILKRKKRKINTWLNLHEPLSNWAFILVLAHLGFLFFDAYAKFTWTDLLIPFSTSYKPLPMALGIFSLYILTITIITTKLRKAIGIKFWRKLHVFTPIMYILVTVHSVLIGTDFQLTIVMLINLIPVITFSWIFMKRHDSQATA
ncbi:ferric reductase-like transmembrane domain-containing protein [Ectobacillus sp. sgz5001026]|uniref:ferric reductase-like transmembrane domain-containing protein n=1 Tax=Ectobacillus sp. sgz5001026 TaxID=3242473 RepID=UPI0036D31D42